MRLSAKDVTLRVAAIPASIRPIRIRGAGLTYCLDETEALDLANQLADAVAEVKTHERIQHD